MKLEGAQVLVMGMGRSGLAAVELLRAHGARVTAADSKPAGEMAETAATLAGWGVPLVEQGAGVARGFRLVVLSPGVPADLPAVEAARAAGTSVIGEVELASWFLRGPVIGHTGANGKTTTTALTGHILRECGIACQVGGNIGLPPTAMVAHSRPDQWNVLELSSFQLETIGTFRAQIASVLNLTPDHMDRHYTMEQYAAAKGRIFENQTAEDSAILNAEDAYSVAYAARVPGDVVWFSRLRPVPRGLWYEHGNLLLDGQILMPATSVPLRGLHNLENVMAAAAAASLAGAGPEAIAAAVSTFPGVEHRLEFVAEIGGVGYFNDSKATNVDATLKALDAFDGGLWVILGGRDKGSDFTPLRGPLAAKARAALLIGEAAAKMQTQLHGAVTLEACGSLDRALETAASMAQPGDVVLLAPACASFDQFQNFEHRGRVFKELVRQRQGESREE